MGLNLKDEATVALVTEVATRLGTSKTGAVRLLAQAKLDELDAVAKTRHAETMRLLATSVWPRMAGKTVSSAEQDESLGYDDMFIE